MVTRDQILYSSKSQDALSLGMLLEGISLERVSFSEYVWKVLGEVLFPLLDCGAFKVQLVKTNHNSYVARRISYREPVPQVLEGWQDKKETLRNTVSTYKKQLPCRGL